MKILAVNASARRGGNTEQLIGLIEKHLRETAAQAGTALQYEYVSLFDLNLSVCRGCRACFDKGEDKCPLKDGLLDLYNKLLKADGIIFASPVYVEDVSAVMKNFIDRMAFNCHRPSFAGKSAIILTTSGMGSSNHSARTMQYASTSWGLHVAGKGKFSMGALMDKDEVAIKFDGDAKKLGVLLYTAASEMRALKPSFYSLLVFKVQQKCYLRDEVYRDTYDHTWWKERGLLDPRASFYIQHRANPLKAFCAKCLAVPVAKIFT